METPLAARDQWIELGETDRRRDWVKGEQLHALARDVFYGKRGRISVREIEGSTAAVSITRFEGSGRRLPLFGVGYGESNAVPLESIYWCFELNVQEVRETVMKNHDITLPGMGLPRFTAWGDHWQEGRRSPQSEIQVGHGQTPRDAHVKRPRP